MTWRFCCIEYHWIVFAVVTASWAYLLDPPDWPTRVFLSLGQYRCRPWIDACEATAKAMASKYSSKCPSLMWEPSLDAYSCRFLENTLASLTTKPGISNKATAWLPRYYYCSIGINKRISLSSLTNLNCHAPSSSILWSMRAPPSKTKQSSKGLLLILILIVCASHINRSVENLAVPWIWMHCGDLSPLKSSELLDTFSPRASSRPRSFSNSE